MTTDDETKAGQARDTEKLRVFESIQIQEHFDQVKAIHSGMGELKAMMTTMSNAQLTIAEAARSVASTFKATEDRYERIEKRYQELADKATGKGQIPLKSHYWSMLAMGAPIVLMSLVIVLGTLFYTRQEITASLNTIKVNQGTTQQLIRETQHSVETGNTEQKEHH